MSKHKENSEPLPSQPSTGASTVAPATVSVPDNKGADKGLPKGLYLAFIIAIVAGVGIFLGRDPWLASRIYSDVTESSAGLVKDVFRDNQQRVVERDINDGFDDRYGVVQFRLNAPSVAKLLSQCEENPPMAAKIFRRCMDEGNKNARMIALYSAFYLVPKNQLDRGDIERIVSRVDGSKESDVEIRKAAQRTLSEMIVIKDAASKLKYEALPSEIAKSEGEWPSPRIETLEETRNGAKQLRIRWSNPDTALAWWKQHGEKGNWSAAEHAWVIP